MAGVFRKTMIYLGLMEPDEDEYYDDVDDDGAASDVRPLSGHDARERYGAVRAPVTDRMGAQVLEREPIRTQPEPRYAPDPVPARIATFEPASYNDARAIGEKYREGVPVIMNVSDMSEADAKRLVDFAAGLTFGLHGSLERVTPRVFLLSPADVEVTAADRARIAEAGFFNQS